MNAISVKELREKLPFVRSELKKGTSFLVIYKSKPIAELKPVKQIPETGNEDFKDIEKITIQQWERDIPPLTPEELKYYLSLPPLKDKE